MEQGELFSRANNDDWNLIRMEELRNLWKAGNTIEEIAFEMKAPISVVAGKVSRLIKESD